MCSEIVWLLMYVHHGLDLSSLYMYTWPCKNNFDQTLRKGNQTLGIIGLTDTNTDSNNLPIDDTIDSFIHLLVKQRFIIYQWLILYNI